MGGAMGFYKDPLMQWLTAGGKEEDYWASVNKGAKYQGGTWVADPMGTAKLGMPSYAQASQSPTGGAPGQRLKWAGGKAGDLDPGGSGLRYGDVIPAKTAGGASSGSSSSFGVSGGGPGGYNVDAQIAAMNKSYAEDLKRSLGGAREAQNMRGIFTGDFSAQEEREITTKNAMERAAMEERLRNQKAGFDFQMSQAEASRQAMEAAARQGAMRDTGYRMGGGEGDLAELMMMLSKGQGGGIMGPSSGYKGPAPPSSGAGGGAGMGGGTSAGGGAKPAGPTRRDASSMFWKKYGFWPNPSQLDAFIGSGYEGPGKVAI